MQKWGGEREGHVGEQRQKTEQQTEWIQQEGNRREPTRLVKLWMDEGFFMIDDVRQ